MKLYSDVVLDRNGNVVSGATVTVTDAAGASATVYSSNSTSGSNANPLTTTASGRFTFYAQDGSYTLTVTKTGITTTTQSIVIEDTPTSVREFGAIGDGVHDDTTAINNALAAGSIYLPAGVYLVSTAVVVPAGTVRHILGDGPQSTVIRQSSSTADGIQALHVSSPVRAGSIRNLTICAGPQLTTGTNSSGVALNISGANGNWLADNIDILGFSTGIKMVDSYYAHVTNFQILGTATAGIQLGPHGTIGNGAGNLFAFGKISNNGFTGNNASSIGISLLESGGDIFRAIDVTSYNNNIVVKPNASRAVLYAFFTDVLGDTSVADNWIFDGSNASATLDSVVCNGCWASYATGGSGVVLKGGVTAFTWNDGRSRENGQHGFSIQSATEWQINGTMVARNSKQTTRTYDGVNVTANVGTGAVIGCRIGNFDSTLSHEQLNGITISGTSTNIRVIGNDLSNPGTGGVGLSNTSSGTVLTSNNLPIQLGYDRNAGAFYAGCTTSAVAAASTVFLGPNGAQASENLSVWVAPRAGRITFAYAATDVAPGVGKNFTYTVRKNTGDTSMTFSQSGNASFSGQATTNSFTVAAGDIVDIKLVTDAAAATPNVRYSLVLDN